MEDFVLKDQLRHWAYVFPETMLIYEMKGKAPNLTADLYAWTVSRFHMKRKPQTMGIA